MLHSLVIKYFCNIMKLITYATHSGGTFDQLMQSGYHIEVLGWGTKWEGFMDKFNGVLEYLKTQSEDEIIVFMDGFDSLVNKSIETLEQDFKSFNCKILISHEDKSGISLLLPRGIHEYVTKKIFPLCRDGFVANTGLYMGYCRELKLVLNKIKESDFNDDQRAFNSMCKYFPFIQVDDKKVIFENLSSSGDLSNAYFVQYPATINDSRFLRAIREYSEYFIPEITAVIIICLLIIIKIKNKVYK